MVRLTVNVSTRAVVPRTAAQFALTLPELALLVLEELPNYGLVSRLRLVCTVWKRSGDCILLRWKKIDRLLDPYFADVPAFRRLLCDYDGLISGSFALSFFRPYDMDGRPTRGPASDMDLYFEWVYAVEVAERLEAEGYSLIGEWSNADVGSAFSAASVPDDSFESVQRWQRGVLQIDVVYTTATPAYCVFSFHSTCVMNIITWNRAYCMFAIETLVDSIALVLRINNDRTRRAIDKYAERGFKMLLWREGTYKYARKFFGPKRRWIGDQSCWTVEFEEGSVLRGTDPVTGLDVYAVPPTYDWTMNGMYLHHVQVFGPTWGLPPDVWLWMPVHECVVVEHRALLYSYAADPAFAEQFKRYVSRRTVAGGPLWMTLNAWLDTRTLHVLKTERIRCDSMPDAEPDPLYG